VLRFLLWWHHQLVKRVHSRPVFTDENAEFNPFVLRPWRKKERVGKKGEKDQGTDRNQPN
jgi:hypothetical protein